jgi:hypothetical protein
MRMFSLVPCLLLTASAALADIIPIRTYIPEFVGGADVIVVAKVSKTQKNPVAALPYPNATKKEHYQILEVKVEELIHGAKDLATLKIGVPCMDSVLAGGKDHIPMVSFNNGQVLCLAVFRHHSGDFYELGRDTFTVQGLNRDFDKDVAAMKKCVKLLADPDESLKSKDADERFQIAAALIRKYRGPFNSPWAVPGDFEAAAKKTPKQEQEPIAAEQSKLILQALAEADWSKPDDASPISPENLFLHLGLTDKDGWKAHLRPGILADKNTFAKYHKDLAADAREWLKTNGEKYRIKRIVEEKEKK